MTDYLTKLASRALGVALAAQPVVPSIFAPESPLAEAISSAWSEQHRQEGLDLEAPGWSSIPSQAVRRARSRSAAPQAVTADPSAQTMASTSSPGPAVALAQAGSQGLAGLDDAGSADAWTRGDLSPSPAWPAEPDPRSSQGLLLQPVGQETEGRPATPAGQHRVPGLGGQASPAVAQAASAGVVQRQSDAAAHRNAGAPDMSARASLADAPRTPSLTSNERAVQQAPHAPSGGAFGMPLFESGGIEARPAPSAGRAAPEASLPTNWPASEATPDRVTVTRAWLPAEAGFVDLAQSADAGDDPTGFGLLLPAQSEQTWRWSPEALAQRASREQVSSPPAPAPVIEVTIGRVEVRAVQADRQTGKPKAAAPPVPPLSLEAYLRQQRGNQP